MQVKVLGEMDKTDDYLVYDLYVSDSIMPLFRHFWGKKNKQQTTTTKNLLSLASILCLTLLKINDIDQ